MRMAVQAPTPVANNGSVQVTNSQGSPRDNTIYGSGIGIGDLINIHNSKNIIDHLSPDGFDASPNPRDHRKPQRPRRNQRRCLLTSMKTAKRKHSVERRLRPLQLSSSTPSGSNDLAYQRTKRKNYPGCCQNGFKGNRVPVLQLDSEWRKGETTSASPSAQVSLHQYRAMSRTSLLAAIVQSIEGVGLCGTEVISSFASRGAEECFQASNSAKALPCSNLPF